MSCLSRFWSSPGIISVHSFALLFKMSTKNLKVHLFQPFGEHGTHTASYSSPPFPRWLFLEPFSGAVVTLFSIPFLSLALFFAASCWHGGVYLWRCIYIYILLHPIEINRLYYPTSTPRTPNLGDLGGICLNTSHAYRAKSTQQTVDGLNKYVKTLFNMVK
jgi:hypothetical protein